MSFNDERFLFVFHPVLRTGTEIGKKGDGSRVRKGIMVEVGWEGQESEEYEVVGNLPGS